MTDLSAAPRRFNVTIDRPGRTRSPDACTDRLHENVLGVADG